MKVRISRILIINFNSYLLILNFRQLPTSYFLFLTYYLLFTIYYRLLHQIGMLMLRDHKAFIIHEAPI